MDRRTFMRSAGTALAVIAPTAAIAATDPAETPQDRVIRLSAELKQALVDLDIGPVRAWVTSDAPLHLQNLTGDPIVSGKRVSGVPVQMLRRA